jgi:SNF2 family DNA or RNA helicase
VFKTFPKKKEVLLRVEMTQKQRILAKTLIEKNFEALSQFEKQKNSGVKVSIRHADNILIQLRMIANHPLHLTDLYGTEIFRSTSKFTEDQV